MGRLTNLISVRAAYFGRAVLAVCIAAPAQAETLYLCWQGGGGYSMTGQFSFPDNLRNRPIITELDVTEFSIKGYFEGEFIGSWDMSMLTPSTSWRVRYDPRQGVFPFQGFDGLYQMWNANGAVDDCGNPGFGFNSGNGGQDVCVDNTYIATSTIEWDTPIVTSAAAPQPGCTGPELLGDMDLFNEEEGVRG